MLTFQLILAPVNTNHKQKHHDNLNNTVRGNSNASEKNMLILQRNVISLLSQGHQTNTIKN